ncbi:hypothetical protein JYU34_014414 [Plutella xylostella]|uniref:ascorbate ferrireductase (transmembrane) n=2 Tax=Plutella xylostella TaxID=51655 RepID=A0A8S4F818_PLUXY|nr:uncharacterized protein LOC105388435 [Plutella xylostella]KAG7301457.1 hypothetical protein JYU34_014414 [Plutella xylostella]CAG9123825.1 unnamed protein product [Plutella xylostella]
MDRPSTSRQSLDKVEMYEVREHVPYQQAEVTRAPTTYDEESGAEYDSSSWKSAWRALCQLFNLLHHMMSAIVVFCLWHFALTSNANGQITNLQLHIVFAGTGYQLFLVEAVLTLHRHNSWSFNLSEDGKRIVHGCLQVIGAIFVMAGTFLALSETKMTVNTAHGILGVIAFAFTLLSFVTGIITLFSSKVKLMVKAGPIKIFHIAVGLFALSVGLVSIVIGFHMDYFRVGREGMSSALMAFVLFILLYVLVQPLCDLVSTTKRML